MDETRHDSKLKERYYLIDSVRGILIIGVVIYHALFDYAAFFGISEDIIPYIPIIYLIRDIGCFLFVLISGVSVHFGRKRFKRSVLIFACGAVVSIVTRLFIPEMTVIFGVLSFFGLAGLLMIPFEKILKKVKPIVGLTVSLVFFLLLFNIFKGYIGWGKLSIELPDSLYANVFTAILGLPPANFESSDYFPLLPWIFAYFAGYFLWSLISANNREVSYLKKRIPFFVSAGKYTLWIYLAHQPVLYGITLLITNILD